MKLVLDGVFNHLGKRNVQFAKAMKGESPQRDWFFLGKEFGPDGYKCWSDSPNLVELRLEARSCQDYLWRRPDSAVATWLKRGADGWRLDVASEIGYQYVKDITDYAHKHKEGSLVAGEVWSFPSKWNKAMDGTLSLHGGQVLKCFVAGDCPGPTVAAAWNKLIEDSSIEAVLKCWLVMSNHDQPRLAASLPDLAQRKLALALQFSLPGSPLIYYGDELGMDGEDDPMNRAAMQWEKSSPENDMQNYVKNLVSMRRKLRALRIGDYTTITSQRLLAFMRTTDRVGDTVVVLANGGDQPVKETVIVPNADILGHTQIVDELTGELCETRILGATLTLEIPAKTVKIFSLYTGNSPSEMQYKRIYGHVHTMPGVEPFDP
jgi:glycosidase